MADNEQIVRSFIAAWSNLDVDELVGYFGGYLATGLIAIALLLAVAILLAQMLSRRISGSLQDIATDLQKVGEFELSEQATAPSRIREIAVVGDAPAYRTLQIDPSGHVGNEPESACREKSDESTRCGPGEGPGLR